jgi:CRP/FNR family cyclic AMP-dependent transcriptional regulator
MARTPIARNAAGRADPWHAPSSALRTLEAGPRARLEAIAGHAVFTAGEIVLRDGAITPFLGLVEAGRIGLRLSVPERGNQTVVTIEPGELVGWSAVVPPYRATAEAVALEPTRVVIFEAAALRELLATDAELAGQLLPAILATVSDRLTTSWQQLLDLFSTGSPEVW